MTIALGADHGGFPLKAAIISHLEKQGVRTLDLGVFDDSPQDYPDYALPVCERVLAGEADFGILVCGTGIGMSIAANKIAGIRCALLSDVFSAKATRAHNDANVMALGARAIGPGHALEIVDAFLQTDFSRESRHIGRIDKITQLEKR